MPCTQFSKLKQVKDLGTESALCLTHSLIISPLCLPQAAAYISPLCLPLAAAYKLIQLQSQ